MGQDGPWTTRQAKEKARSVSTAGLDQDDPRWLLASYGCLRQNWKVPLPE
jgi:hypothetical protein